MRAHSAIQALLLSVPSMAFTVACGSSGSNGGGAPNTGTGGSETASGGSAVGGTTAGVGGGAVSGGTGVTPSGGTTGGVGGGTPTGGSTTSGGAGITGGSSGSGGGAATGGAATGGDGATGGATSPVTSFACGSWDGVVGDTSAPDGSTRVDFNEASRQEAEVNEAGWNPWPTGDVTSESLTLGSVTFTVSMAGSGTSLTTDWYKVGVQTPNYARLVGDALTVADGNSGGAIELEISGLSAGTHSLLAYHNGVSGNQLAEMNVDVNGTRQVNNLVPTNRALSTDEAASSYVTFTVSAGETVTILYSPSSSSSSSYKNVIINALALDVPNTEAQATGESPSDRDYHVDADDGSVTLSFTAAEGAVSHDIYFGTDRAAVTSATPSSPEYRGAQTGTTYEATGLSNLRFYWWRVDETDARGVVTRGKVWSFSPRHLAFPDAEGYGRFARGGRCGSVVHVTNLNDSGAGSLREAVENEIGPRTIVFDVSGIIRLASRLTVTSSFVTVAGQTAPGKGVTIRAAPFGLSGANDAVIRNLRVRLGRGQTYDGMGMSGSNHCILDHNSISWTIDEAFSSRNGRNITLQRTLISECLNVAGHQNYPAGTAHGYAASIGGDIGSFHHNLLAHCAGRNWSLAGGLDGNGYYWGRLDIFNNVVYNWDGRTTDGGAHEVNFVNNYYRPGAASSIFTALNPQYDGFPGTQQYYMAGNVMPGHFDESDQMAGAKPQGDPPYDLWVSSPFFPSHARIDSAGVAFKRVLSDVGCTAPVLDDHDVRVVEETRAGTYTYSGSVSGLPGLPDDEADVGGFEDYPEEARAADFDTDGDGLPNWYETYVGTGTNSPASDFADANADPDGDGYTHLDDYLQWMATPHAEVAPAGSTTFDLASLFRGYTDSPSYVAGTDACLQTSVSGSTLTVTATSACGIVYLPVTVTDGEGSTDSREVALFVAGSARNP